MEIWTSMLTNFWLNSCRGFTIYNFCVINILPLLQETLSRFRYYVLIEQPRAEFYIAEFCSQFHSSVYTPACRDLISAGIIISLPPPSSPFLALCWRDFISAYDLILLPVCLISSIKVKPYFCDKDGSVMISAVAVIGLLSA